MSRAKEEQRWRNRWCSSGRDPTKYAEVNGKLAVSFLPSRWRQAWPCYVLCILLPTEEQCSLNARGKFSKQGKEINGKHKKSQISIHPGGRQNPSKPQPARRDLDCFGMLLWLMGRGEKKQASPLGFSYAIFDSSHSYQRWFLAGCSGSKSSNHSPYFLILAAVSHRQCYCQMLKDIRI